MKQILCFGDSNTYGYIPENGNRYPWGVRWTSLLNEKLGVDKYHIIEEGLCGRTTVYEDAVRENRNGSKLFPAVLETAGATDLIILMLGTNDCKQAYHASAEEIGEGIRTLLRQAHRYAEHTPILLVSPIHLGSRVWEAGYDPEFSKESVQVSKELETVYQGIAKEEGAYFLAASRYAHASSVDEEHLNEAGHRLLADAIYSKVIEILQPDSFAGNTGGRLWNWSVAAAGITVYPAWKEERDTA